MPADEDELLEALEDGVVMKELLAPKTQKDGVLTCKKVVLGEMDASGRQKPVETEEEVQIPGGHDHRISGRACRQCTV